MNRESAADRAAFRAYVRAHHPDRGGDPEAFAAGLAGFRRGAARPPAPAGAGLDRFDRPVEVVADLPLPVRVGVALIRTWRRHRRARVQ